MVSLWDVAKKIKRAGIIAGGIAVKKSPSDHCEHSNVPTIFLFFKCVLPIPKSRIV